MDARADDATALTDRFQGQGYQVADGRIDDRGIERLPRHLVGAARPGRAQAPGEGLAACISGARESEDRPPLPLRHLRHDVTRSPEAIDPELLPDPRDSQ